MVLRQEGGQPPSALVMDRLTGGCLVPIAANAPWTEIEQTGEVGTLEEIADPISFLVSREPVTSREQT
jgi:hypothetical protein